MSEKSIFKPKQFGKALCIIDDSVLRKMLNPELEIDAPTTEILNKLKEHEGKDSSHRFVTTLTCLFRAIWLSKKIDADKLKKVISLIEVLPIPVDDFKDEEATRNQLIKIAGAFSGTKELHPCDCPNCKGDAS